MRARCVALALGPLLLLPRMAFAAEPSQAVMDKLAASAEAFETMRTHASYLIKGELRELDGEGKVTSTKSGSARVVADGHAIHTVVLQYLEDGKDETGDARKKAKEADEKRAKRPDGERLHMPFLPRERSKYTFDEVEHDPHDPARVRVTFVPKEPSEHTIEGSAWIDENDGRLVSAGFKVSRLPWFVDYIHFTVEFGAATSIGPAVSKVSVEGGGGVLFFHKHFVGVAALSEYSLAP